MPGQPAPQLAAPVVGFPASQAYLTAQVYNPLSFLLNPPSAFLYANTTQSVASGTSTLMTLNTAPFDPYGAFNATTHAWVVPVTGWYDITGQVNFTGASGGNRAAWVATDLVGLGQLTATEAWAQAGTGNVSPSCGSILQLTAGQSLALVGFQSSGSSLATVVTANSYASLKIRFAHL